MTKRLHGMVCAMITPMLEDGSVDLEGVARLTRHLVAQGVPCLYPNGTNGESLSLTVQERRQVAEAVLDANQNRAAVYIQCGASTVSESYAHVLHARDIGADGAGLMTPVFFPVDESAMEQYYDGILRRAEGFPLYAYNIPSRSGNDISPALLGRLMERYPALLGIKFSLPDLLRFEEYVGCCRSRSTDALIGCDRLALSAMVLGGAGWVSGPGACFCPWFVRLYDEFRSGDLPKAMATQRELQRISDGLRGLPEIPAVKYMLKRQGVISHDTARSPLRPLTDEEKERLDAFVYQTASLQ